MKWQNQVFSHKGACIKIKLTNVFDLALSYLSDKYVHYLRLPKLPLDSAAMVMQTLGEAANSYVKKHGVVPVLFIDGADLLAKHNVVLFSRLITQAKIMANSSTLSIVFVSSEGSIMPLLKNSSGMNRSTKIFEVDDISERPQPLVILMASAI